MANTNEHEIKNVRHRGRLSQTFIYLGKLFRMFLFQSDWKVLPMSAIIAGLVCFVIGANLFKTMEGTMTGTFAVACICIWNGFFNSIQSIVRERPIVKREHRSGLHISSYVAAHMIYQAFLCLNQTIITILIFIFFKVSFPAKCLITPEPIVDIGITIFLTTYCADMMALLVSAIVRNTTTAMTIMPFLLIFQLIFSGGFFSLSGPSLYVTNFTISKWSMTALCSQGDFNSLPMVSTWNSLVKLQNVEYEGAQPVKAALVYIQENDMRDDILMWSAQQNQNPKYAYTMDNLLKCWGILVLFSFAYAAIAVIFLEMIDKDKR